jgi:hypothetical protein
MTPYMREKRAPKLSRFGKTIKSVDEKVTNDNNKKEGVARDSENETVASVDLTLDDFGGRSDALGG